MALVKSHKPNGSGGEMPAAVTMRPMSTQRRGSVDDKRHQARTLARQQQAAERIASAASQLASGVTEASSAAEELGRSMEQIATGAQQAASASEECTAAMTQIADRVRLQKQSAETAQTKTQQLQALLDGTALGIGNLIDNVDLASQRQNEAVKTMAELEQQASNIGESVSQVIRIADQTNLLALNAAIEAARAGKHGKGFAVVADTVRTLAEASEKNASGIADLIKQIQEGARTISGGIRESADAAGAEAEKGKSATDQLRRAKRDMAVIMEGASEIAVAAVQMETASQTTQKGVELISTAAEEQSSAAEQARKSAQEQSQALAEAEKAANELDTLSDELKNSTDIAKSAEEVAASAEELSASIQELARSGDEILKAIDQISDVAAQQSSAAEECVAGTTQIENSVKLALDRAQIALEKGKMLSELFSQNKVSVDEMIHGIRTATEAGKESVAKIQELEQFSRRIDKIVDAIANVAIQTSMLAVNGAVEAARAGEFGKGFAVVSTDIQNLANDAAENAEQIKDLVKAIQDQIIVVRNDLIQIAAASIQEVEKAKASTEALAKLEADMAVILDGNQKSVDAAGEIVAAAAQAKKGIEQIASAAEEATTATSQASSAAKQQSQAAEELSSAIEHIASVADELQSAA